MVAMFVWTIGDVVSGIGLLLIVFMFGTIWFVGRYGQRKDKK